MPNKGKEKFITISVKNYSTRKHFREHQNNLLKEIYSPIRRESSSLKIRKSSRFNPSIMEEIPKATTAFD